jgi:DNA repair photolyase
MNDKPTATEHPAPGTPIKGRGASWNPQNRFETLEYVVDDEAWIDEDAPPRRTIYLRDPSRSIIAHNDSPDIGFDSSLNPYRGCEHGCTYCFARPTHEYLGFSAGLDFESKIVVKEDAPELLRQELMKKSWQPETIMISGVTDPYQPIERKLEITRRCLAVLAEFRNPVALITKNQLVTRDVDYLGELAQFEAASVALSVTTLDPDLHHIMEPRTSTPANRLAAIETLAKAGIPVAVMAAPLIPAINDHELPERKEKVLGRIREMRDGKLYNSSWGQRGRGTGKYAEQIHTLFDVTARKLGFNEVSRRHSIEHFRRPSAQGTLFD